MDTQTPTHLAQITLVRTGREAAIAHSIYDMALVGLAIFTLRANGVPHH